MTDDVKATLLLAEHALVATIDDAPDKIQAQRDALDAIYVVLNPESERAEYLKREAVLAAHREAQTPAWLPIESAPHGRKVIVGWVNELGNWRSTLATYYEVGKIELDESPEEWVDEEGRNTIAGWWEDSQTRGEWYLDEKPTHWTPAPSAALRASRRAPAAKTEPKP